MGSVVFDRAADYYDATRSLPPETMERVVHLLRPELSGRRCLEIGVGTGRMALPLRQAGATIAGVDLSFAMLRKLIEKEGGGSSVPVAVADATILPFGDDSFGTGMACHVLHLIKDWRSAAAELVRVVSPRGVILIDLGGWGPVWLELERRFEREAAIGSGFIGVRDPSEVDEHMATFGATCRVLPQIRTMRTVRLGEMLDRIEAGLYSFTWRVQESVRVAAARATRSWAEERFGSLDEPFETDFIIEWRAYDLP